MTSLGRRKVGLVNCELFKENISRFHFALLEIKSEVDLLLSGLL